VINYDNLPEIEMKRAWFMALEDRSSCIGPDRPVLHRFRCNLDVCNLNRLGDSPRWIVGTFFIDEEAKAETLKCREKYREDPWGKDLSAERIYPDHDFIKTRWERVVFTDGAIPEHSITELLGQVERQDRIKAQLGL